MLLSPAENSSYSNQNVDKKKIDFGNRELTSLKLSKIFELAGKSVDWNAGKITRHRDEMIGLLSEHYGEITNSDEPRASHQT